MASHMSTGKGSKPTMSQTPASNVPSFNNGGTGFTGINLPPEFEPLSPWAYFGLSILYSIPVVGLIFLIVFSLSDKNINRRNFTRSYFCLLIVFLVIMAVLLVTGTFTHVTNDIATNAQNVASQV